jgi:dolichol-phosphate mannosyltransferase
VTREIANVILIPSYNELEALPDLLKKLESGLTKRECLIVVDDSEPKKSTKIKESCLDILKSSQCKFIFLTNGSKCGRGAAIRQGMIFADHYFPNIEFLLECDADGSHRPEDILMILRFPSIADLVIGSRYLEKSSIRGWSISRRVFSFILNKTIPRIFDIEITDITNGLRRYSRNALRTVIRHPQVNSGFIYLSEQAALIKDANLLISEVPIIFENRVLGQSTVSSKEILSSLIGIIGLAHSRLVASRK